MSGSGNYYYCAVPVGQDGTITVTKTGYVTNSTGVTGVVSTSTQQAVSVANVKFQVKIVVADELGNSTTGDTVNFGGNTADISSSNTYYFARTEPQ